MHQKAPVVTVGTRCVGMVHRLGAYRCCFEAHGPKALTQILLRIFGCQESMQQMRCLYCINGKGKP